MSWFGKITIGIIVMGLLAICADIITWIYEEAWIIPIILTLIFILIVWKKSFFRKKRKLKQLVKAALVDGKITEKEKQTIINKAKKLGMDSGEGEIHIEAIIHKTQEKAQRKRS